MLKVRTCGALYNGCTIQPVAGLAIRIHTGICSNLSRSLCMSICVDVGYIGMDPVAKTKLIESLYEVLKSASFLVLEKGKVHTLYICSQCVSSQALILD